MCSTQASSQLYFEHNMLSPLARTLTYSCPVLQYPGPFFTTMLLVPSVESPHAGGHGHHMGPVRADHAALRCDPNIGSYMRSSAGMTGPCWPLTPNAKPSLPARPLSMHFETLPNHVRAPNMCTTPRRAPSPVRMGLATNPRVRRRSADPSQPSVIQSPAPSLVWVESPMETPRATDPGGPGPIKGARPSRRSSSAKELLQHIKRTAKKKIDRFRRSLSSERLSGQRSRSSILRSPDGSESSGSAAQHRRISSPCMIPSFESSPETEERNTAEPLEDTFPRGRLIQIHPDGSHTVRLVRHPKHAFGFFVSLDQRNMASRGMFISRMAHPQLEERLAGLLDVGDELLTVENVPCATLTLEQLQAIVGSRLVVELRVQSRPFL